MTYVQACVIEAALLIRSFTILRFVLRLGLRLLGLGGLRFAFLEQVRRKVMTTMVSI